MKILNFKKEELFFLLLFAVEFTYYLLILQTGIVEYHHSNLKEIWMLPVGGISGIILSIKLFDSRKRWVSLLLLGQMLLTLFYPNINVIGLFILGVISGVTAPILIYRINNIAIAITALGLSYFLGTTLFFIDANDRVYVAFILSLVAFFASFFANVEKEKKHTYKTTSIYTMSSIFLWLLLDAALFETLSRDNFMHLWGVSEYMGRVIIFHILGLIVAYKFRKWHYNDIAIVALFIISYASYSGASKELLVVVYPFAISYYNGAILYRLMKISYLPLAIVSLSLWGASGLGLLIALMHSFMIAWLLLLALAVVTFIKHARASSCSWCSLI